LICSCDTADVVQLEPARALVKGWKIGAQVWPKQELRQEARLPGDQVCRRWNSLRSAWSIGKYLSVFKRTQLYMASNQNLGSALDTDRISIQFLYSEGALQ
jgi:hypothetical protein